MAGTPTNASASAPIRIVVVEDSPIQREALIELFEEDPGLKVVAAVATGEEGVKKTLELKPDLVTCDIGLPDIDGFEVVTRIMSECPTPIVMLTATLRPKWRKDAYHALTLGAIEVIEKPEMADLNDVAWRGRLQRQLRFIARSPVIPHVFDRVKKRTDKLRAMTDKGPAIGAPVTPSARPVSARPSTSASAPSPTVGSTAGKSPIARAAMGPAGPVELVCVVASAGGPKAVRALLDTMRPAFPLPVPMIVALHLGRHMGSSFAGFLGQILETPVTEFVDGMQFTPGGIYVAPGRMHTEVLTKGRVRVFENLPEAIYSPSLDYLLWSVARVYGKSAIGAIMTGMGGDGADGLLALRRAGGMTVGQDEASCLVYGMPRVAAENGAVMLQQPPAHMAATILDWLGIRNLELKLDPYEPT